MTRKRFILGFIGLSAGMVYLVSPFLAAFEVRQAMKSGDKPTLEWRVEWEPVRQSLKASLADLQRKSQIDKEMAGAPRPSIWNRMKAMVMPTVAESFVDRYVTPEGMIQLFAARTKFKDLKKSIGGTDANVDAEVSVDGRDALMAAEAVDLGSTLDRMRAFYSRIRRAEFRSPTEVEFEVADQTQPDRRFISTFELKSLAWKLTGVKITGVGF
jgi:Protein of unknown function (DUF2939)